MYFAKGVKPSFTKYTLVDGLIEVDLWLDVGAVGDHNAHRDAEREEQLAHGVEQDLQEPPDGQPLDVRRNIIEETLHARAGLPGGVGRPERQRIDCDHDDKHEQHRHHEPRDLFNAALHAVIDNEGRHGHK